MQIDTYFDYRAADFKTDHCKVRTEPANKVLMSSLPELKVSTEPLNKVLMSLAPEVPNSCLFFFKPYLKKVLTFLQMDRPASQ